ncbi:glycosyltransferase [Massilia sp. PWRC2]|uniref:glycosyltransferase n=1 Tax=Massilia sp. PWRC2 TaxID=2804626 RepID=UPI003CE6AF8F
MRIVIDLQGAQSASRFRGIGRYSLALAQAIARNPGEHEIWLVMNGGFGDLLALQNAFSTWVARDRMRVFDTPLPVAEMAAENEARCRSAELLREFFIAQLEPDAVLVTSLFEGFVDDAVVSVGNFIPGGRTAVVLYDLIPLLHPDSYLGTPIQKQYYARKIDSLRRAGLLLAISDHAMTEALGALELPDGKVVAISAAVDTRFCAGPQADEAQLRRLGLERPFVMYAPGGTDARKNLHGLIDAFALLPATLQNNHQLLIASGMDNSTRSGLQHYATKVGLPSSTLVLSGYVDDQLLAELYRTCTLFVFPSLHEGFGLPALEAMACGAAVIGADNSSIPEAIGLAEALFDASDPAAMAAAMARALSDQAFRSRLRDHGRTHTQLFSWDITAARCLRALEQTFGHAPATTPAALPGRQRLAFVSPLPPERSGIADYAAQLLPALLPYFDIELVLHQKEVHLPSALAQLPQRDVAWFMDRADQFPHIIYQFGNSPFHGHMFAMLEAHPGVVVLHDFYLSRVLAYEQMTGALPGAWTDALYHSHGYPGLLAADQQHDSELAHDTFPCNLAVLQNATEIIVHSRHSKALAADWYGEAALGHWHVVPLPRAAPLPLERSSARLALGIDDDVFLVCSFGFIAPTKLTLLLIEAWQASALAANKRCLLILVGANHGGAYGEQVTRQVEVSSNARGRITIAGWTDDLAYHQYLCAADAAVQLRCISRGETSAAVLDCLNYGLATIVNANGSMAELPRDAVCMLDEIPDAAAIRIALERLYNDLAYRQHLGMAARALLATTHRPDHCAALYAQILATASQAAPTAKGALTTALAAATGRGTTDMQQTATAMARLPDPHAARQLMLDVTTIVQNDLRTGIERVVRAQVLALLRQDGRLRIEPVRLEFSHGRWQYHYAHAWTQALLGIDANGAPDHVVDVQAGDILFGADYAPVAVTAAAKQGLYDDWRARGVSVQFQVYDLLPVLQPQFFPEGAAHVHAEWLTAIGTAADQLVCISGAVASELAHWLGSNGASGQTLPRITSLHLGADFDGTGPATPARAHVVGKSAPAFLMVGTIEPRKGYLQALAAFELLWQRGVNVSLNIVATEGWTSLPNAERRTIPQILQQLHRLMGDKRLSWRKHVDDAGLEQLYLRSACLLAASEGEGFGLPLIEAARHHLPVLARDLTVFREVGGDEVQYFNGADATALADAIEMWLGKNAKGEISEPNLPWYTWDQHAALLSRTLESS